MGPDFLPDDCNDWDGQLCVKFPAPEVAETWVINGDQLERKVPRREAAMAGRIPTEEGA